MISIQLVGNLTRDPEVKTTQTGKTVANFTVAAQGKRKDETVFFDVEAWGSTATFVGDYFTKGKGIALVGYVREETWEKDGQKRSKKVVVADNISFVSNGNNSSNTKQQETNEQPQEEQNKEETKNIPF